MSSIFCRSTLRQATLAHLFAGAVKAGAPEAFTAPAKMEGGKAAGRNAPRGPSQRLGGEARQPALRSPGAPSGGGRGGGEAGENPQGSTAAPREGRGAATDKKRPGALSPKPGFAGLCPGAGACRRFRRGITHHCRQETLVRGSGFGPGKRRHLKHPAQGRLCRLLGPCAGC